MAAVSPKYIMPCALSSFALAWSFDYLFAELKLFGGTNTTTVLREWIEETDKKFAAWPRTAGPPVAINPISRQNFIVRGSSES